MRDDGMSPFGDGAGHTGENAVSQQHSEEACDAVAPSGASSSLQASVVPHFLEGTPFRVLSSAPGEIRLEFILPEYTLEEFRDNSGHLWQRILLDGSESLDVQGSPSLPVYRVSYGSRPGADVSLQLLDTEVVMIKGVVPPPSIGPLLYGEEPPMSVPSSEIYSGKGIYPSSNAWISSRYQIRDIQGSGIVFAPFRYDPVSGGVEVVTRCVLSIRSSDVSPVLFDTSSDFAQIQRRSFVNSETFGVPESSGVGVLGIVMPQAWRSIAEVDEFIRWKIESGWTVKVGLYPSDTGDGADGVKSWISSRYAADGLTHLVILGDHAAVPPAQKASGKSPGQANHLLVGTDTPYALLAGEDDLSYADIFLGRIPFSTASSAERALPSLVEYEKGGLGDDSAWTVRGVMIGSAQAAKYWPYAGKQDKSIIEAQRKKLSDAGLLAESSTYYAKSTLDNGDHSASVQADLNAGASLLLYLGHGSCTSFVTTKYQSPHAQALVNGVRRPFVMAPNCNSGNLAHGTALDYECNAGDIPFSLGQAFFEADAEGGALGTVMSSGKTYWNPPIRQVERLADRLVSSRGDGRLATQGAYALDALYAAVEFCDTYADDYAAEPSHPSLGQDNGRYTSQYGVYHAWCVAFFGDPSGMLRVGAQCPLTVSATRVGDALSVQVSGFSREAPEPVAQCAVTLVTASGSMSGRTDSSGNLTLPLTGATQWAVLRALDASAPLSTTYMAWPDADGDGFVSNRELASWIANWASTSGELSSSDSKGVLAKALETWRENPPPLAPPVPPHVPGTPGGLDEPSLLATFANYPLRPQFFAQCGLHLKSLTESKIQVYLDQQTLQELEIGGDYADEVTAVTPAHPELTLDEIQQKMASMARVRWPLVRPTLLGASLGGRKILGVRVSLAEDDGAERPQLFLASGIHGDEPRAVSRVCAFLDEISEALDDPGSPLHSLLGECVLWVVPVLSPDAYASGRRCNGNAVALERGFPRTPGDFSQGELAGLDGLWGHDTYFGEVNVECQPEQAALVTWLQRHRIDSSLYLLHGDSYVAYEPNGSEEVAQRIADAAQTNVFASSSRYPVKGSLMEWQSAYFGGVVIQLSANKEVTNNAERDAALNAWLGASIEGQGGGTSTPTPASLAVEVDSSCVGVAPGAPNPLRLFFSGGTGGFVILRVLHPDGWSVEDGGNVSASMRSGDGYTDFIWFGEDGAAIDSTTVSLAPPASFSSEAQLAFTVDDSSSTATSRHVFAALPRTSFPLTASQGWRGLSVPLSGVPASSLGASSILLWKDGHFLPSTERFLQPNTGYFALFDSDISVELPGFLGDSTPRVLAKGMHLLGTSAEHLPQRSGATLSPPLYRIDGDAYRIQDATAPLLPGEAYWFALPAAARLVP